MTKEFKNLGVVLHGIKFRIKSIVIIQNEIKIIAETGQENHMALNNWFDEINYRNHNYKRDIDANPVKLIGVFPVDYDFYPYNFANRLKVFFSVDSIIGDINLINRQQERKEKLERLNVKCNN